MKKTEPIIENPRMTNLFRPDWDQYFMVVAKVAASRSTCLSRPVGAIVVLDRQILATGYNGSMPGDPHCLDEGVCFKRKIVGENRNKYDFCRASHAEANLMAQAARRGIAVAGGTLYVTLMPCYTCTKLMAVAGIREVVYEHVYESGDPERDRHWQEAMGRCMKFRQLKPDPAMVSHIVENFILPVTSRRRMDPT